MVDFQAIQEKWQKRWEEEKVFEVNPDKRKKFYVLEMFPYPSGSGLHLGHALNYTIGDIFARFKLMNGFNVLHPMGYDSLGLPAENAAIKAGIHPQEYTDTAIKNFIKQQKCLGITYDWSRVLKTSDPSYYKWDQWIFLKMFEKGLAYKKESPVNWCPECNSVLANEQVHNGKCWRHEDTEVQVKNLSQWFLKITDYVEELNDFSKLNGWPDLIKKLQENWIGKSYGTEIIFEINKKEWKVFTTRPDTLYGVTFMVVSAQHPKLRQLVTDDQKKYVEAFTKKLASVSEEDIGQLEKEGVFTGSYAIHPLTKKKIPVFAGNFVLADYGSGMVMAVPTHDQRDFEFAKKYDIPLKVVITPKGKELKVESMSKAFVDEGVLVNSDKFDGLDNRKAIDNITKELEKKGKGKKTVNYKLRDWLISRQRYWGTPIPIVNCQKCGAVADENLPVELPHDVKFGLGNPLETNANFINTTCPKCGCPAKRETDTMDTFVNSSWYQLRYVDSNNDAKIFDKDKVNYWNPIDMYIGGKEHACMHLIYIRFYTKVLRDIGLLDFDEPAVKLFNQGMLHAEDGNKMSKSLGNVINPLEIVDDKGADALRIFLVSVASPDSDFNWSDKGLVGSYKFLTKVIEYFAEVNIGNSDAKTISRLHKAMKGITWDIENLKYNLAVIKLRKLFERLGEEESMDTLEIFLKLLSPFCPHMAEELWEKLGKKPFLSLENWPKFDEKLIDESLEYEDDYFDDLKSDVNTIIKIAKIEKPKKVVLIVSPGWKYELVKLLKKKLKKTRDFKEILKAVMGTELKRYGKDITKILPGLIKDPSKLPTSDIDQKTETQILDKVMGGLVEEFNAEFDFVLAEDSKEGKAKQAIPGKPAILVE